MWPRLKIEKYKVSVSGEVIQKHAKETGRLNWDDSDSVRFIPGQESLVPF